MTQEEVKDNKDRLTTAWQPQQGFEALIAQIETCLVYGHFSKKVMPNKDLINTLFVVIKEMGCYQVGYNMWELIPENQRTN